jgi:hypothetical protein
MSKEDDLALWGELREGIHIAGYTFERAAKRLESLLEGSRWKLGRRFKTVNDFLGSIRLDNLRGAADARKRLVERIKTLQPKASNRKIAKALGVHRSTIDRDAGANAPHRARKSKNTNAGKRQSGANAPLSGRQAAKLAARYESTVRP